MSTSNEKLLNLQHALAELGDDREIYESVLETFFVHTPDLMLNLEDAATQGDWETAQRHAHSLKSSSRTIGGERLGDIAHRIENACSEGQHAVALPLIGSLEDEFRALASALVREGFTLPE